MKRLLFLYLTTTLTMCMALQIPTPGRELLKETPTINLSGTPTTNPTAAFGEQTPAITAEQAARKTKTPTNPITKQQQTRQNPTPAPQNQPSPIPHQPVGVATMLDIINETNQSLTLYALNANNQSQKIMDLNPTTAVANSVTIPSGAIAIYVNSPTTCPPTSLNNDLKAITITPQQTNGIQQYKINPLIPQYNNYIFVYNGSTMPQTALLEITLPRIGIAGFFLSDKKVYITRILDPQSSSIIEIPELSHMDSSNNIIAIVPTNIQFEIPRNASIPDNSNNKQFTITPTDHNSFVITPQNDLIQIS